MQHTKRTDDPHFALYIPFYSLLAAKRKILHNKSHSSRKWEQSPNAVKNAQKPFTWPESHTPILTLPLKPWPRNIPANRPDSI
jgi:hypothetical protein